MHSGGIPLFHYLNDSVIYCDAHNLSASFQNYYNLELSTTGSLLVEATNMVSNKASL